MDMSHAIKIYQHQIETLKPDFLKMILDTYTEYTNTESDDENKLRTSSQDKTNRNNKESLEEYLKGHEIERWNNLLQKLNDNQTVSNNFNE